MIKLELEKKNSQRQVQKNKGFNPQYRRQPLQILQKERKDQDQVQAPLYLEVDLGEASEEYSKYHDDHISTMYAGDEDELGIEEEEEYAETDVTFDGNEIDEYWKQFTNFMQVELHKKYELRSRKRSRVQENEGEQQVPHKRRLHKRHSLQNS